MEKPALDANWGDLFAGRNLLLSVALSGGVGLHALNIYVSTTTLPSIVREIGGKAFYAWNTTLFVVASIVATAFSARLLQRFGPRRGYVVATSIFALGTLLCALAPAMEVMLAGRLTQGAGGGLLLALGYTMVQRVFAPSLWPRAMALLSSMWGVATLLGPAVGGTFAEFGSWRVAFWWLIPVAAGHVVLTMHVLRGHDARSPHAKLPLRQLALLVLAVVGASWASLGAGLMQTVASLLLVAASLTVLVRVETGSSAPLLPKSAYGGGLGALYAMSGLLAVTVTSPEIFLPLFLQVLHGLSPLVAGYMAAIMSAGWTIGAVFSAGLRPRARARAIALAPWISLTSMLCLAMLIPSSGDGPSLSFALRLCMPLMAAGLGVGLAYPHLSSSILAAAPSDEQDHAASAIMTVQLCATAFGAALAGLVTNAAHALAPTDAVAASASGARWLFAMMALCAVGYLVIRTRYERRMPQREP